MNQIIPFWMLNDRLRKGNLILQLKKLKQMGIDQVVVHPRFGLRTKYLSLKWFRAIRIILVWSRKNNFKIWIYDELNWPSGYAGGQVLENDPRLIGKKLVKTSNGYRVEAISWKAAYSRHNYTDLLDPRTTELFIKLVYEKYYKNFKDYFGTTLAGFFTDEPGMYCNFVGHDLNSIPWTNEFSKYFKKINGYSLDDHMSSLWLGSDLRDIQYRVDYWKTISLLYQESYFKKLQQWCHSKKILFVGHLLAEESLVNSVRTQGDFFGAMKYFDWAGYDLLSNLEQKHIITAKLASSAKYGYGLKKVCAETFGVFGRSLNIKEMKLVSGWQIKNGLDVLVPHAFFYSQRGKRRYDCPPSFFERKYRKSFKSFVKCVQNIIRSEKAEEAKVAVYYPRETVWGELLPGKSPESNKTEKIFNEVIFSCYNKGINFNVVDSNIISRKRLNQYETIILPNVSIIDLKMLRVFEDFTKRGKLIVVGSFPRNPTKASDRIMFEKIKNKLVFERVCYPGNYLSVKDDLRRKLVRKIKSFVPLMVLNGLGDMLGRFCFSNKMYKLSKPTVIDRELANLLKLK